MMHKDAERRDLGLGHFAQAVIRIGGGSDDELQTVIAFRVWHRNPKGETCEGYIPVVDTPDAQRWHLDSFDPLTLSPSLLCKVCGDHGFIRDGRWQPV